MLEDEKDMYVVEDLECNVFAISSYSNLPSDDDRKYEATFVASGEAASQTTASFPDEHKTIAHSKSVTTKPEDAYTNIDTDTQIVGLHISERNTSDPLTYKAHPSHHPSTEPSRGLKVVFSTI
jgi:hypothetical protein